MGLRALVIYRAVDISCTALSNISQGQHFSEISKPYRCRAVLSWWARGLLLSGCVDVVDVVDVTDVVSVFVFSAGAILSTETGLLEVTATNSCKRRLIMLSGQGRELQPVSPNVRIPSTVHHIHRAFWPMWEGPHSRFVQTTQLP